MSGAVILSRHPVHRVPRAPRFGGKDEILGPGAARLKIMTRGPTGGPGEMGGGELLITN